MVCGFAVFATIDCKDYFTITSKGYIVWEDGEKLAVSKSKKDSLMERLGLKKD